MIPKFIDSVYNLAISGDETITITMISRYFQFGTILINNLLKTSAQKVLLYVMLLVLILLKKLFFSLLIKLTQRLRCLLYVFLLISIFVFKNIFLRRDLFMFSLFIFIFTKGAWSLQINRLFMGACLWIASSRATLKVQSLRLKNHW